MNFVGFIRNIVFYYEGKKGPIKKIWPVSFAVIMGILGIAASLIAKEEIYFLLLVAGLVINSYSMSFRKPNSIRKSILVTSPMVLLYDVFVKSYGGIVYESVVDRKSVV